MNISQAIAYLDNEISNPSLGLPEELFLFISRITPMVNVDLLIKNKNGRVLLSWRDDPFAGTGWHLPGGIVRFKEKLENRVMKVAESEIGTPVEFDPVPIAINQSICEHDTRGHFISVLYNCSLSSEYVPENRGLSDKDNGYLMWFDNCPDNLIEVQHMYKEYILKD